MTNKEREAIEARVKAFNILCQDCDNEIYGLDLLLYQDIPALLKDNKRLRDALKDMLFAYVNKDGDCPHQFEIDAVKEAEELLKEFPNDKD